jgi:DNA-binding MarR family transcriptional regulator
MAHATKQQLDAMAVADSLRPTLLRLGSALRRERIAGVSPHQVGLLVSIKYKPGITVGELAADDKVSTAAMSKRVTRLERDGLVARTPSEADRRCVGLTLTDEGQRTLRRVRSRRTAWLASRLSSLSPDELAAVEAAAEPLTRLLEHEEHRA